MNRLPLNEKKFKELVKKSKHFNIFPIYLPDYLPEIQEHPITTLLAELVEEAFQYLSIMSNQEIDSMLESLPPAIMMMVDHCPHCRAGERLKRIAIYYVVAEVQLSYFAFKQVIDGCIDNSEVLKIYPELKENFDKDGLLYINDNFILHDGGIEYRNHILHYHQLLRREYKSQPNYDFIANFLKYYYQSNSKNQFRLAIDHYRIMPKEFYSQILEFDTWFGPSFDRRKLDDPNAIGLTIIKRNKDSLFELTNSLNRTEFFWTYSEGIKTFELEEISEISYYFDHYYFNKYIHSERDINQKIFRHIDGAVKVYLTDDYSDRMDTYIPREIKSHKKIKLFRIDGDIDIDNWVELISFFYKSNEMIIEYFNPLEFKQIFEERVRDFKKWKNQQEALKKS